MSTPCLTVTLFGGQVLAKLYKGELCPVRYSNRSQAQKKQAELGDDWKVYHMGRPFYVARKTKEETTPTPEKSKFKVWVQVEDVNVESDTYENITDPEEAACFDTAEEAKEYAAWLASNPLAPAQPLNE